MILLDQLAQRLGCELRILAPEHAASGSKAGAIMVAGVSGIPRATGESLVFASDEVSFSAGMASAAAAIIVTPEIAAAHGPAVKPLLLCPHPKLVFARAAKLLGSATLAARPAAIHPAAVLAPDAILAPGVSVGACAVVEQGVRVGPRTSIGSGAVLGRCVVVGSDCRIYPRAVLYAGTVLGDRVVVHSGAVLGSDGFGYVRDPDTGEYLQFPQQGKLVIEDDVEIGANTTIDRGALEETRIARGAKIDNLVHIGHNVSIGRNAILAAQTGISGSSAVGDGAILGGQVGIGDHAAVGEGVILGGQAGILPHKTLRGPGVLFWGTPAQPVKRYLRQLGALARLTRDRAKKPNREEKP
jgi:UDP-3-O-[3-hydroxymyristoyl] glucosamine N-acyltransferase